MDDRVLGVRRRGDLELVLLVGGEREQVQVAEERAARDRRCAVSPWTAMVVDSTTVVESLLTRATRPSP